jgi:hypothetical protein
MHRDVIQGTTAPQDFQMASITIQLNKSGYVDTAE